MIENETIDDNTVIYLGSHNLSWAAWGRELKNKTQRITNSEIGLIFLPKKGSQKQKSKLISQLSFKLSSEPFKSNKPFLINNF